VGLRVGWLVAMEVGWTDVIRSLPTVDAEQLSNGLLDRCRPMPNSHRVEGDAHWGGKVEDAAAAPRGWRAAGWRVGG
jgi:hypothetical protein